jgi:hypothetical protein
MPRKTSLTIWPMANSSWNPVRVVVVQVVRIVLSRFDASDFVKEWGIQRVNGWNCTSVDGARYMWQGHLYIWDPR